MPPLFDLLRLFTKARVSFVEMTNLGLDEDIKSKIIINKKKSVGHNSTPSKEVLEG